LNVAKSWEKTFYEVETPKTIKTAIMNLFLGKDGGAFVPLINPLGFFQLDYGIEFIMSGSVNVSIRNEDSYFNNLEFHLDYPFPMLEFGIITTSKKQKCNPKTIIFQF
jgi:hypothetical protein